VIGVLAACCTAFYMLRLFTLTFLGKPRDHHAFHHAHESPRSMTWPLALLAVGTVLAVFLGWPKAFGGDFRIEAWLAPATTFGQLHGAHGEHGSHELAWKLASISTLLGLGFAAFGYFTYKDGLAVSEARAAKVPFLHRLLLNKYYVDEGVELCLLGPIRWFGNVLWKLFDVILIDGVGVNLPGALTRVSGDFTALFQTGRVRNYALSMALGAALLLYVFLK
jgi:NADH-quinone oxidoreductase subunit L